MRFVYDMSLEKTSNTEFTVNVSGEKQQCEHIWEKTLMAYS